MSTKPITLTLRPVADDGALGAAVATATLAGKATDATYDGSPVLADVVAGIVRRFDIDERTVFARLAADGWSNGKMVISADAAGREESIMGARVDLTRLHNLAEVARQRMAQAVADAAADAAPRNGPGSWYKIENKAKAGEADAGADIYLYDMIGDWGVSAQDFVNDLRKLGAKAIDLHVNCEGGEVFDGLAIYETLRRHPASITAIVDGIAASAASFVVQAADKIIMAPRARLMIHDAHGFVGGNARDMREMANLLDDLSDTIADIYAERSGGTRADWRKAMQAAEGGPDGSWYDATNAVKAGLADEVRGEGGRVSARTGALVDEQSPGCILPTAWYPAAFLGVIREVEAPKLEPVKIPDGQALLEMFKTP
jgi:ATP-dependent protease ClpP protease subunit